MNLREYIDSLKVEGYTVRDDHGDDPMLIAPDGKAVETWRENYPYETARVARSSASWSTSTHGPPALSR